MTSKQALLKKIKQYRTNLKSKIYFNERDIENIGYLVADYKTDNVFPSLDKFTPFVGKNWFAMKDTHYWFHFTFKSAFDDEFLKIKTSAEGWDANNPQFLLYLNGEMVQGLDVNHVEFLLEKGKEYDAYLYAYTSYLTEYDGETPLKFYASLVQKNVDVEGLYYDVEYPLEMLNYLGDETYEYQKIVYYVDEALSMLSLYDLDSKEYYESVAEARKYLKEEFYGKYCNVNQPTSIACMGHTHIDCAWLWTFRQTREKVQRTFSTVLRLMERYPEYKFTSSQPLLYKYCKEEAPEIYEQIKKRVKEGRWEVEGAMWVEADCNLTSGESLVRQVLYGKKFIKEEFGVDSHILWLPDVFGYSAALPQILRKSGVDWFVTSKISWNDTNRMPYDTFKWKGIDGTEINTFFLTAQNDDGNESRNYTTYVGMTNAEMIQGTYKRYTQKELSPEAVLTYGWGDGGGGPTSEHLELLRRSAYGIPGSPVTKPSFAGEFLDRMSKRIEVAKRVPKWQGELYLEYHRGTYTTQARNKMHNRRSEFLYQKSEFLSTIAEKLLKAEYPTERLAYGWENILSNQFHDVIPGSSIAPVYEQCEKDYAVILGNGNDMVEEATSKIASAIDKKEGYVIFNPHSFTGDGLVEIDGVTKIVKNVAQKGYFTASEFVDKNGVKISGKVVETEKFKVTFNDKYQIISLFDKENEREVLKKGEVGNELRLYDDYPNNFDAWEWQEYSKDKYVVITNLTEAKEIEDGVRKGLKLTYSFGKSTITQKVWFYDELSKIDFETVVDWHEKHCMLKTAFPVDVNCDKATYEIQYGYTERPTHFNTSWDEARFEVCAHKYADVSEGGYGVSIINDCKYGHDIHDGVIQLSLLRSPDTSDVEPVTADNGKQVFTYAICPHKGTLNEAETVKYAYYLNDAIIARKASGTASVIPTSYSAVSVDKENVLCDVVKKSEDGRGVVVRLYECKNERVKANVKFALPFKKAYSCDLTENIIKELEVKDNAVTIEFNGFDIETVYLK